MKYATYCFGSVESFPLFCIDKCVQKFLNKLFVKRNKLQNCSGKKGLFISLEFLGNMSLEAKKQPDES